MSQAGAARFAVVSCLLLLFSFVFISIASAEKERGDTALFYEGQSFVEAQKWNDAAGRFSTLLERYPKSILRDLAYFWLFRSKLNANRTNEAEKTTRAFRKEFPDSPLLAKAEKELAEARERVAAASPKKAEPAPRPTVLAIRPADTEPSGKSGTDRKKSRREKAIALYRKIIHDAPISPEADKARARLKEMGVPVEGAAARPSTSEKRMARGPTGVRRGEAIAPAPAPRMQASAPAAKSSFALTISQVADVQVEIKKDRVSAYPGEFAEFPLRITNRGNAPDAFRLSSDIPAEYQPAFFADRPSDGKEPAGGPPIAETPAVGVDESFDAVLRIRLPIGIPDGQKLEFGVRVSSRFDPSIGRVSSGAVVAAGPLVTGTFRVDRERVKPGGALDYVIRIANSGTAKTREVRVTYVVHPNLIFLSAQPTADSLEQTTRTLTWALKEIPSGSALEIDVKFKVADETAAGQEIINRGSLASSAGGEPALFASPVVTVEQVAGVRVDGPRDEIRTTPGDRLYLPFSVKNIGNGIDGFALNIAGGEGTSATVYVDSNADGTLQAGEPKISGIQNLPAHGVAHLLVEAAAPMVKTDGQKLDITFQAESLLDKSVKDRAGRTLIFALPVVSLSTQVASRESIPGGIISYQLMALNSGSGVARQVSIIDDLPPELEYVNADLPPAERNGRRVLWKVGELGPNQKRVVTVSVRAKPGLRAGTVIQNETRMTYEDLNGNSYE